MPDARWPAAYLRLLAARLALRSYFFVPYIVLYAQHIGIALGTLLAVEALFALLIVVLDLPAGHLADVIGPRRALVLGALAEGAGAILLGTLPTVATFWLVQPLFAGAQALTQGTDVALASGVLRATNRSDDFERGERLFQSAALGWGSAVLFASSAFALAGFQATFLATGVMQLLAALTFLTIRVEPVTVHEERPGLVRRLRELYGGIRAAKGLPLDLLAMVLSGTAFSVLLYLIPVYYVRSGIDPRFVGVAAGVVGLVAMLLTRVLPAHWNLRIAVLLALAATLVLWVPAAALVLAAAALQVTQARLLPRFRARVRDELERFGPATAMSIVTTTSSLGFAIVAPLLGIAVDRKAEYGLLVACLACFLVAGIVMSARLQRAPQPAGEGNVA